MDHKWMKAIKEKWRHYLKKTWTLVHYPKERRQLGEYRSSQLNIKQVVHWRFRCFHLRGVLI